MLKKRQNQILEEKEKITFEDLNEERQTFVKYEGDLPEEFQEFVARIPNLREFLLKGYEILARTRSYPAKDMRAILKFVAVGRLQYAPSTFDKDIPEPLKNRLKIEWGKRGAYITKISKSKIKKDQEKFKEMSSDGGKAGTSLDKTRANDKSWESRIVNQYGKLYESRPSVGNKDFDNDLSQSPLMETSTLRMGASRVDQNKILQAMEEARKQARKEKKSPFVDIIGSGGVVTKITPLSA